jgi:predicted nucleic acid-binding Zn ribbon protein
MKDEAEEEFEYTADLVKHRQVFRRIPQAIDRLVNRVIARRGVTQIQARDELLRAWAAACDPDLVKFTRVGSVRNRKLEIKVANSLVNQQLTFDQSKLLRSLQERIPEAKLQGLVFKIGNVDSTEES